MTNRTFKTGDSRDQTCLLPPRIEDYVGPDNPVRAIESFVCALDLAKLGFRHADRGVEVGQPPYDPADLLKLYLYGYINQVRSSRRLEREACRNLELIWLLKNLRPGYRTIANFRKENWKALKAANRNFVLLVRELGLVGGTVVAIDGSFFHGDASKASIFTRKRLAEQITKLDQEIEAYDVKIEPMSDEPALSANWGEEGLSAAERLYAWNTLEVLAMSSGNIEKPANAIPGRAHAVLQLRFVVGTKADKVVDAVRAHLHGNGFPMVEVRAAQSFAASRTDFDSPWINWAAESIRQTTGKAAAVLPNFGGSLPNDVFSDSLGLPTIWVPHSYPGCSQHAPDEHILLPVTEEALGIMAGLFWDLGEMPRAGH